MLCTCTKCECFRIANTKLLFLHADEVAFTKLHESNTWQNCSPRINFSLPSVVPSIAVCSILPTGITSTEWSLGVRVTNHTPVVSRMTACADPVSLRGNNRRSCFHLLRAVLSAFAGWFLHRWKTSEHSGEGSEHSGQPAVPENSAEFSRIVSEKV